MTTSTNTQTNSLSTRRPAPRPLTQMTVGCLIIPLLLIVMGGAAFFYMRSLAEPHVIIPAKTVALVRTAPAPSAPLLARFGSEQILTVTGRSEDWRWLEVDLWGGQQGWMLRPLDTWIWQIVAYPTTLSPPVAPPSLPSPVPETMIALPATTFTQGSPPNLGKADEQPAHPVSLTAFEIDRTEVTMGQYWHCVIATECPPPTRNSSQTEAHYSNDPSFDNHPALNVSWTGANRYCLWRGKHLPTEAEWEMAAGWDVDNKAKMQWPWGNDPQQGQGNVDHSSVGDVTAVGSFPSDKSPAGVLDMAGNVSEWVFDWYKVDYYKVADDTDPRGPSHRRGEGSGRSVRGASFADSLAEARSTNRRHQAEEYGYTSVGFRCVKR